MEVPGTIRQLRVGCHPLAHLFDVRLNDRIPYRPRLLKYLRSEPFAKLPLAVEADQVDVAPVYTARLADAALYRNKEKKRSRDESEL